MLISLCHPNEIIINKETNNRLMPINEQCKRKNDHLIDLANVIRSNQKEK